MNEKTNELLRAFGEVDERIIDKTAPWNISESGEEEVREIAPKERKIQRLFSAAVSIGALAACIAICAVVLPKLSAEKPNPGNSQNGAEVTGISTDSTNLFTEITGFVTKPAETTETTAQETGSTEMVTEPEENQYDNLTIICREGKAYVDRVADVESIVIPAEYNGCPVVSILYGAFFECNHLKDITFPAGLTDFGFMTGLWDTTWMKEQYQKSDYVVVNGVLLGAKLAEDGVLRVPDGVTAIAGSFHLSSAQKLTELYLPAGFKTIGQAAFEECTALKKVSMPEGVEVIGEYAFAYCRNLSEFTFPKGLKTIDACAFTGCASLKEAVLPDGLETIGGWAFSTNESEDEHEQIPCKALRTVSIPDSVTVIGRHAFAGSPWMEAQKKENPLVIVNNILIDGTASKGDVVIPDGVKIINDEAFYIWDENAAGVGQLYRDWENGNPNIRSVTIPESVKEIRYAAFANCKNLKTVHFPNSSIEIGDQAFQDTEWIKENSGVVGNILVSVPDVYGLYEIPDSVYNVLPDAFCECKHITEVKVPSSLEYVQEFMFSGCDELQKVTVAEGVKRIGFRVFKWCDKLKTLILPDSLEEIEFTDDYYGYDPLLCNHPSDLEIICSEKTAEMLRSMNNGYQISVRNADN